MFVTIVEGMYAGDTCLVKTIDVKNKVIVAEVDAFGRKIDTEFSLHEVQKASDEVK
jgi:transcription antitermination factor NusG